MCVCFLACLSMYEFVYSGEYLYVLFCMYFSVFMYAVYVLSCAKVSIEKEKLISRRIAFK